MGFLKESFCQKLYFLFLEILNQKRNKEAVLRQGPDFNEKKTKFLTERLHQNTNIELNANKCAHIRFWNRLAKNILIKNSITQLTLESKQIEGCKRDTLCARYVIQNIPHFRVCKNELRRVQTDYSHRLFFLRSIVHFFTRIYMNCFVSSYVEQTG